MPWGTSEHVYMKRAGKEEEVKLRQKQFSAAFEKDIQHPFLSHIQTHFHIEKEIKKKAKKLLDWWLSFSTTTMVFIRRMASYSYFSFATFHGSPIYCILRTNTSLHIFIFSVSHSQKSSLIFLVVFLCEKRNIRNVIRTLAHSVVLSCFTFTPREWISVLALTIFC